MKGVGERYSTKAISGDEWEKEETEITNGIESRKQLAHSACPAALSLNTAQLRRTRKCQPALVDAGVLLSLVLIKKHEETTRKQRTRGYAGSPRALPRTL